MSLVFSMQSESGTEILLRRSDSAEDELTERARRLRSTLVANACALFIAESSRGLFLSSLYLYFVRVDENATQSLALAVSCFSWGRLLAAFVLPFAVDRGCSYKSVLVWTFVAQIVGHLVYILPLVAALGASATSVIVVSRTLVGFGSGTLSVCRGVVADVTAAEGRLRAMAWLSFAKFAGYALCPGVGILLALLSDGPVLNSYSAPAFLSIALCTAGLLILRFYFHPDKAQQPTHTHTEETPAVPTPYERIVIAGSREAAARISRPRCMERLKWRGTRSLSTLTQALLLFMWLNFITKGALAVVEASLGPEYATTFGPDGDPDQDLEQDTAELALGLGVLGLLSYLFMAMKPKARKADVRPDACQQDNLLLYAGGDSRWPHAALLAYRRAVQACSSPWADVRLTLASLLTTALGLLLLMPDTDGNIPIAKLTMGLTLVWSLAAPVLDVLTVSCFSVLHTELTGGSGQAVHMGYLSSAGAIGRIAFPAFIALTSLTGVLVACVLVSALGALLTVAFYRAHPLK